MNPFIPIKLLFNLLASIYHSLEVEHFKNILQIVILDFNLLSRILLLNESEIRIKITQKAVILNHNREFESCIFTALSVYHSFSQFFAIFPRYDTLSTFKNLADLNFQRKSSQTK